MSLLSNILNVNIRVLVASLILIIGTIAPGFLIVYIFKPEILYNLTDMKIIFFSSSLSLPYIMFNTVLAFGFNRNINQNDTKGELISGVILSIFVIYPVLFISYIFHIKIIWFIIITILLEIVLIIRLGLLGKKNGVEVNES